MSWEMTMRNHELVENNLRYIGKRTNKNILNRFGVVCLQSGALLVREQLERLADQGVRLLEEDIALPVSSELTSRLMGEAIGELKEVFSTCRSQGHIPLESFRREIVPRVERIIQTDQLTPLFAGLLSTDEYTYRHSLAVTVLSVLMGRWLSLGEQELSILLEGALLHDIGKVRVPSVILNKPGPLSEMEYKEVRAHTRYGSELISQCDPSFGRHALIALEHHERVDGSGYPDGKLGDEVDRLSRIVAVADVFHAMCSRRVYKESMPLYEVMREMEAGAYGAFDPEVVTVFIRKIMESLIGCDVLLTDGGLARIIQIHPEHLSLPLIYYRGEFIDLGKERGLGIVRVQV